MEVALEAVIVIPCFNEASRLRADGFRELLAAGRLRLLFVDDGSTDGTLPALQQLCRDLRWGASVLSLPKNVGKAEAVRQGLLQALTTDAAVVGYLDADLATPPAEMLRIVETLRASEAEVAVGCRLQLLGAQIVRKPIRELLGKTFSLAASVALGLRFRDTQCGAKAFRATSLLRECLEQPFHARWAFDVELLGRLLIGTRNTLGYGAGGFVEVPLRAWSDVDNSKLRTRDIPRLGTELFGIALELARLRSSVRGSARQRPRVVSSRENAA